MSYCLNPDCPKPQNRSGRDVCRTCGFRLLLKERYRAVRLIGQGGFGRTFLAIDEDKPSKPQCVIKQFLPVIQEPRHVRKAADLFEREAVQLEALGHHAQIPELLAHFSQEGRQYLVQEFIEGKTLVEIVQAQGVFSEAQVREVLASLLPLLGFIHAQRVIHRDIKPNNIIVPPGSQIFGGARKPSALNWDWLMQTFAREASQGFRDVGSQPERFGEVVGRCLADPPDRWQAGDRQRCQQLASYFTNYSSLSPSQRQYLIADASRLVHELRQQYETNGRRPMSGQLVLVDFGAVKEASQSPLELTGTAIGSPEYLAPEQARGKATFASDLYSLGVTCLYLLVGRSPSDLFDSHQGVWVWQPYLTQPISETLIRILNQLTEPRPSRRYATATEVLLDLGATPTDHPDAAGLQHLVASPPQPSVSSPLPPRPSAPAAPALPNQFSFDLAIPSPKRSISAIPAVRQGRAAAKQKPSDHWTCGQPLTAPGKVYAIALSPTVPLLVSSSGASMRSWDWQTGQVIGNLTGHLDLVLSLAIAPSGNLLVSGSADKSIKFWQLPTGKRLASLTLHTDSVLALAISADGAILASSSLYDPLGLIDIATGQERGRLAGHCSRVDALGFDPISQTLASGDGDGILKVWDVLRLQEIRSLVAHTQAITCLAYSPDGKTLATGSSDGTVKLWSTQTYRAKRTLTLKAQINGIAFATAGKTLAIASHTLQLWNPRTGELQTTLPHPTPPISLIGSGFGTIASVSGERSLHLWQFGKP